MSVVLCLLYALFVICHALLWANAFACVLAFTCAYVYGGVQISLHLDASSSLIERLMYISVLLLSPGLYLAKFIFDKLFQQ